MNYLRSLRCFLTARRLRLSLLGCLLICLCVAGWWRRVATPVSAATVFNTITVTTTVDENGTGGNCSLREAIRAANTNAAFGGCPAGSPGMDTIVFNLPFFVQPTINVGSGGAGPLPIITEPVVIDGSSAGRVELNGASAGTANNTFGLSLETGSDGSTIRSLVINRFRISSIGSGGGINLTSSGNTIQNCYIGTDAAGTGALPNESGVFVQGSNNTVGGTTAGAGNVISGNRWEGVMTVSSGTGNKLEGNYIGTNASGTAALPNWDAVRIEGQNNIVGGTAAGARNIISGNNSLGINITDTATGNKVEGNYIGTNASGMAALSNTQSGVGIGGQNNTVGGTAAGARNIISGNGVSGVYLFSTLPTGNKVEGNYIGVNASGTAALPNAFSGVFIDSENNTVGGTAAGARNIISGNTQFGVYIQSQQARNNQIQGNYIGAAADGQFALGNGLDGIAMINGGNNLIGGSTAGAGNLISGNGRYGVLIQGVSNSNKLEGNYIGTNASGAAAIANTQSGVLIETGLNIIGGTQPGARNIISGNGGSGIFITGALAAGNKVEGNYIGVSVSGTTALPNGGGVVISGSNNKVGGTATGAGNLISGNSLNGVHVYSASAAPDSVSRNNEIKGNYIGANASGTAALPNAESGVKIEEGQDNTVGGPEAGARNVISGNGQHGVFLYGSITIRNLIIGNYIGTTADGLSALGNGLDGVAILSGQLNSIGLSGGSGNVISGNGRYGVLLQGAKNGVINNFIGTNVSGTAAIANLKSGVAVEANENGVGGDTPGGPNLISGNAEHGVVIGDFSLGSRVVKNYIGVQVDGQTPLGNGLDGVFSSTLHNLAVQRNFIAFNGRNGLTVTSRNGSFVGVSANSIFSNSALGIDLAPPDAAFNPIFGLTPNDNGDGDSGPNGLMNFPVLTKAVAYTSGANTFARVQGSLDTNNAGANTIQLFLSPACDASGHGEGKTFLGEFTVTIPAGGGVVNFNQLVNVAGNITLNAGDAVTATATPPAGVGGGTSEFSACIPLLAPTLAINDISVNEGNSGTTNVTFTVTLTGAIGVVDPITVNYTTANGSALASSDYVPTNGMLTFSPPFNQNTVTQTISVPVIGDTTVEANETFNVNLTANVGATLIDSQGVATIVNDDGSNCSTITVNPATLLNGLTQVAYSQTLSATGGTGSYTFNLASGTLPAGLMLSGNMIVGTPTAAGASTFTIRATDDNGCFGERTYTIVIGTSGLMYYPLARPVRLLDTRPGASPNACFQPNAPIPANTPYTQPARGMCEGLTIPANATTITGNVTTVQSGGGYLTLYPSDAPQPTVANTNYLPNEILNNAFTVGVGANDGAIKIFVTSNTDVVVDVTGYYAPPSTSGLYFHPLPKPIRLLETRQGQPGCITTNAPLLANSIRTQTGIITCDGVSIPSDALALVGNATTVDPATGGYLTLYPANATQPFVSSSNFVAGQIMNAPFTVGLSPSGDFKIFTTSTTQLVIDITGYYSSQASSVGGQGLLFTSLGSPLRLLETRPGQPGCYIPGAPMNGGAVYTQQTQIACTNLTPAARALIGNATVVNPTGSGWLTFWPSDVAQQPTIATSNYTTGQVFNRYFTIGLAPDGSFKRFSLQTTHLVIDVSGFFAP